MPDEFGDDNFDDIFDDLKTGRKQNHQFREVLGAKRPFSGREIFRVDIRRITNSLAVSMISKWWMNCICQKRPQKSTR